MVLSGSIQQGRRRALANERSAGSTGHRRITSSGLPPMAERLISNFKSNKNDS